MLQEGNISFNPALSSSKQSAIQNAAVWGGFKAFFEFSSEFYPTFLSFADSETQEGQRLYYDASYGQMEDSLEIMKRGFKVAIGVGVVGFLVLAYLFLDYKGSWINFACCGFCGIAVSYIFILSTQYYTDYNYHPV